MGLQLIDVNRTKSYGNMLLYKYIRLGSLPFICILVFKDSLIYVAASVVLTGHWMIIVYSQILLRGLTF